MPYCIDLTGDSSDEETWFPLNAPQQESEVDHGHLSTTKSSQSHDRQPAGSAVEAAVILNTESSASPSVQSTDDSGSDIDFRSTTRGLKRKRTIQRIDIKNPVHVDAYHEIRSDEQPAVPRFKIRLPPRLYPNTTFERGRRANEMQEGQALKDLLSCFDEDDEIDIHLDDFSVYWIFRDTREHLLELPEFVSLQDLFLWPGKEFFFDGYLCAGAKRVFVRKVPFDYLSIGNFENLQAPSAGDNIWIASERSQAAKVFYRLGSPEVAYERFHSPFLWTATLVKHVADYLYSHKRVQIHDFRTAFFTWLCSTHGDDAIFVEWLREYGDTDFRRVIAIQTNCLRSQIETLGGLYVHHPLWEELICARISKHPTSGKGIPILTFQKKKRPAKKSSAKRSHARKSPAKQPTTIEITQTVVTPYVYSCFKDMWFGKFIYPVVPTETSQQRFASPWEPDTPFTTRSISVTASRRQVCVGDVVAIKPDQASVTKWKKNKSLLWYFLVQSIKVNQKSRKIHGLWLYTSSDTTLSSSFYPNRKELFLSDHCQTLNEEDVVGITSVSFFSSTPKNAQQLFVRSRYDTEDAAFFTLQKDDLVCKCNKSGRTEYKAGQTVLVRTHERLLQPVILQESTSSIQQVRARVLQRATTIRPSAPANELLYSNEFITIPIRDIERHCDIRIFLPGQELMVPYSCGGIGNCFFITEYLASEGPRVMDSIPKDIVQGIDFTASARSKLNGLDLFCGAGCFGHSVEEASAVEMKWAVDMNKHALHSYYANTKAPSGVQFFCGSVDDFLLQALQRKGLAPAQGLVHFIIAGSPCQGFSLANQNRGGPTSLKNISLIASTAAYVDFYRPQYVLLENVRSMAQTHKGSGQNAFSQLLATYVGMGYQAQTFNLDACVEGAPQQRSRLIIALSAPGLATLKLGLSHRYPEDMTTRSLGTAPNNLPFGERDLDTPRAFNDISIAEACIGLPVNLDGKAPSVRFPDHRPPVNDPYLVRQSMMCIPRGLPGSKKQSPATALLKGLVPQYIVDSQPNYWKNPKKSQKESSAFARVWAHRLAPTILATFSPADSFGGQCIHWEEDRPLSIEDARRAQQFPREMVIFGTPLQRWKQIGNSVPRGLSLALGIALRKASDRNSMQQGPVRPGLAASENLDEEDDIVEMIRGTPPPKTEVRVVVPAYNSQAAVELGGETFSSPSLNKDYRTEEHSSPVVHSPPKASTGTISAPGPHEEADDNAAIDEDVQDETDEDEDDVIYVCTRSTPSKVRQLKPGAAVAAHDEATPESQSDEDIVIVTHRPRPRPYRQSTAARAASSPATPHLDLETSTRSSSTGVVASSRTSPGDLEVTIQVDQVANECSNSIDAGSLDIFDEPELSASETAPELFVEPSNGANVGSDDEMFLNEYEGTQWA